MTYIVTTFSRSSHETDHEFNTLEDAVQFFNEKMTLAYEMNIGEPILLHPSGSGAEWVYLAGWSDTIPELIDDLPDPSLEH